MSQLNRKVIVHGDRFLSSIGLVRIRVLKATSNRLKYSVANTVRETAGALRETLGRPILVHKSNGIIVREYKMPVNQVVALEHDTKASRESDTVTVEFKPARA